MRGRGKLEFVRSFYRPQVANMVEIERGPVSAQRRGVESVGQSADSFRSKTIQRNFIFGFSSGRCICPRFNAGGEMDTG